MQHKDTAVAKDTAKKRLLRRNSAPSAIHIISRLDKKWSFLWNTIDRHNIVEEQDESSAAKSEEEHEDDYELEQLLNMIRIPMFLEKFMLFALLTSLDCFLYYFTVLPIRLIKGYVKQFKSYRQHYRLQQRSGHKNKIPFRYRITSREYKERCMIFIIVISSILLSKLDTSKLYHRIKRQSTMKLYMLFSVLEMADKMLASLGQSLLTAISLNIAVNSYSNALLTLLLSMQFAEIKSSVLKKFDKEGFFQITIADVVERFKLTLLLSITGLRNLQSWSSSLSNTSINFWSPRSTLSIVINILCGPMVSVVGSEVLVDWAKHAYITKFNRIRPQIYDKFYYIIYKDYSTRTHKLEDRLGLPLPAFVVLFIVMVRPTLFKSSEPSYLPSLFRILFMGASVFLLALLAKFTLDLILIKWSKRIEQRFRDQALNTVVTEEEYVPGLLSGGMGKVDVSTRIALHSDYNKENRIETESVSPMRKRKTTLTAECTPPSLNDIRRQKDSKNPRSLENVARYKMVSKRIW
ncbi:AKR_HP2_G0016060.mRNA.1.CDS.1 [Saccharomyces cerevisiae]|nr:AKR_HP2_G0016060.mRNA.1.CDS.1 [Saccharomyces cerevisiae]CAI6559908.1 AKR_HP2_G0016060.mRNA.1.CDS.1 [Saccharomyces cerevisiae]CAI6561111.1 AKR_HP1_G0015560.mRNA.1.CDS.1 [Saccharomyces cerevisiae]